MNKNLRTAALGIVFISSFRRLRQGGLPRRSIVFLILGSMLAILSYVMFAERINIYTVSAQTDVLRVTTADHDINQWRLPAHAELIDLYAAKEEKLSDEAENFLHVNAGVSVRFQINHNEGTFVITLEHPDSQNGSVGQLERNFEYTDLGQYVDVIVTKPQQLIFPFMGSMVLGDDVAVGVNAVLREGTIRIIEQELMGDVRYVSGEFNLDEGDRVTLHTDFSYEHDVVLRGFVRHQPGKPMAVTAHGETTVARVERLGSAGYDAKTSMWKRFANDPVVIA